MATRVGKMRDDADVMEMLLEAGALRFSLLLKPESSNPFLSISLARSLLRARARSCALALVLSFAPRDWRPVVNRYRYIGQIQVNRVEGDRVDIDR